MNENRIVQTRLKECNLSMIPKKKLLITKNLMKLLAWAKNMFHVQNLSDPQFSQINSSPWIGQQALYSETEK